MLFMGDGMISARGTAIKRRPRDFTSLEGQDFVVETLKHSIESNKIANAYIFSGPRGVGKNFFCKSFFTMFKLSNRSNNYALWYMF
ncbi:DNA polymerase III subunit gamma/tau [Borrelia duttonii CR2A]|uniref:DNA polymerase III subunit gamma/tau n=1 Tax=Borrelia duttonii CR2A TaxID=1432657 RepID=W6THT1_9SPIR|nr:DNA polymerase III subunit gamma/tau [Borrelia duttonii CR2A]